MSYNHPSRLEARRVAQSILSEPYPRDLINSSSNATSQIVFGALIPLFKGDVITNILVPVVANPVATWGSPAAKAALYDTSGNLLASTADQGAITTNGTKIWPLSPSSYTVTANGVYYACVWLNWTHNTTDPTIGRASAQTGIGTAIGSGARPFVQSNTTLSDLGSVTWTDGTISFWIGVN